MEIHILSIITSTPNVGKELGDGDTQVALALVFSQLSRLSTSGSSNPVLAHQVSVGDRWLGEPLYLRCGPRHIILCSSSLECLLTPSGQSPLHSVKVFSVTMRILGAVQKGHVGRILAFVIPFGGPKSQALSSLQTIAIPIR